MNRLGASRGARSIEHGTGERAYCCIEPLRSIGAQLGQDRLAVQGPEPGDLWVRVLLAADGPEDYERSVQAFQHDHEAATEEFAGHLARTLREIRLVEFTPEKTVGREGHGPRFHLLLSQRLADARAWELGERTRVDMHTTLGRFGLKTVDTLIMAGIADTRADAIRWALARIREQPAYERLLERIRETDQLRNEF